MGKGAPVLTGISPARFLAIQTKLGLTDLQLGAKLYRVPEGPDLVREFRTGERPVSAPVAAAMLGFEARIESQKAAA